MTASSLIVKPAFLIEFDPITPLNPVEILRLLLGFWLLLIGTHIASILFYVFMTLSHLYNLALPVLTEIILLLIIAIILIVIFTMCWFIRWECRPPDKHQPWYTVLVNTNVSLLYRILYLFELSSVHLIGEVFMINVAKRQEIIDDTIYIPIDPKSETIRNFTDFVFVDNHFKRIRLFGDSGSDLSIADKDLVHRLFKNNIKRLKTPLKANVANNKSMKFFEYIDLPFVDPKTKRLKCTGRFYLYPDLKFDFLTSHPLTERLGWKTIRVEAPSTYEHFPEPDVDFGSCNNWDEDNVRVPLYQDNYPDDDDCRESEPVVQKVHLSTPYINYIHKCTHPFPVGTKLYSVTAVNDGTTYRRVEPKVISHISNFQASEAEIEEARKLNMKQVLGQVPLKHLKKRSRWLYDTMYKVVHDEFKDVFATSQSASSPIPGREFKIDLRKDAIGKKIWKSQYLLDPHKRLVYIYNTLNNIENGLYEEGDSELYNVPAIVITKNDGRERLAYDLTKLNANTKDVQSYIPSYNWLFELLRGPGLFTVSDIKNFFENIILRKKDRDKCTITSPLGRFRLTRGCYGFKNIATLGQEISNSIVHPLGRAGAFIDDLFIKHSPGDTDEQLVAKARQFLERCREVGVKLNPVKTYFFVTEIEFLGYVFTALGTKPQAKYIQKILNIPKPKTADDIRAYLGVVQYIARYVHELAEWSYWLSILTRKNTPLKWGLEQDTAFATLQERIRNIKLLSHPTDDDPYLVQCDASNHAIAAVLYQHQYDPKLQRKQWKIIEFYSKQVDSQLMKHPIMVKECLAIAHSLNHWKHFLLRRKFYLDTDHKNLIRMFDDDETKAPEMRKKQIMITLRQVTSMFHFELKHLAGKKIILADYLSRNGSTINPLDGKLPSSALKSKRKKKKRKSRVVRDTTDQITLRDPKVQDELQNIRYLAMLTKLRTPPDEAIVHNERVTAWKDPFIYHLHLADKNRVDPAYVSHPISLSQFTTENLEREYIHEFAYVQPVSNVDWHPGVVTDPDGVYTPLDAANFESQTHIKSCMRKHSKYSNSYEYKPINTALPLRSQLALSAYNKNKFHEFDKFTASNLKLALSNSIKNMGIIENIHSIFNIVTKYCINTVDTVKTALNPPNVKNYNTDSSARRRGLRSRKQTKPFWEQDPLQYTSDTSDETGFGTQTTDSTELDTSFVPSIAPPAKFRITYPYTIGHRIAQKIYHTLFGKPSFDENLNHDVLVTNIKSDPLCQHLHDAIHCTVEHQRAKARNYLKANFPTLYPDIVAGNFVWHDGLIYKKPDNKHPDYRLVIPAKSIKHVLQYEHTVQNKDHPGANVMIQTLQYKYYWMYQAEDIRFFVQQCPECQVGKGHKLYKRGGLAPLQATHHGEIVHIDGAGPFFKQVTVGVIVDNYTGATVYFPCSSESAENMVLGLINHWMPYHGIPRKVVTDRGQGFIAQANREVYKLLGIHKMFTSSYHPQTNAKAERKVKELKNAFRMINIELDDKYTKYPADDIKLQQQLAKEFQLLLPSIQFAINQKVHTVTQVSPHMMLYGNNLRDIIDFKLARDTLASIEQQGLFENSRLEILKLLQAKIAIAQNMHDENYKKYVLIMKHYYNANQHQDDFQPGDLVAYYIGDRSSTNIKLQRRFSGPWKILSRVPNTENTVKIERQDGSDKPETFACHVSMLKHYYAHEFVPLLELEKSERAKRRVQTKQLQDKRKQLRRPLGKESKKPAKTRSTNTPRRRSTSKSKRSSRKR